MTTAESIKKFVVTNFYVPDAERLEDTASFLDQGIVDSTGVLELVGFLEQEFGIAVDDAEIVPENFDSVSNLARFVDHKRGT